jgi:hypothetical protein
MNTVKRIVRHRKVGGLHFIRIGWLSLSFCRTAKP